MAEKRSLHCEDSVQLPAVGETDFFACLRKLNVSRLWEFSEHAAKVSLKRSCDSTEGRVGPCNLEYLGLLRVAPGVRSGADTKTGMTAHHVRFDMAYEPLEKKLDFNNKKC